MSAALRLRITAGQALAQRRITPFSAGTGTAFSGLTFHFLPRFLLVPLSIMASSTTISSSQWDPSVVDTTDDEVLNKCLVDIHGVADPEYYGVNFNQAYTVNASGASFLA